MKKHFLIAMALLLGIGVMGQQPIQLRSVDRAECVSSDFHQLRASFSFSTIEAENVDNQRGQFSWLSMPNTVIGGNEGDPQIPVVNELIAVPFGATPRIEVTGYSTTDYRLEDYGMKTLVPRQLPVRKDQRPQDVPFIMNEAAYQSTRGFRSEPMAVVNVVGTMRGVQLGKMTIEPVSYDPVNNTIRVFNNIEVTVHFDGADARATEDMLVKTYSPYFNGIYNMLFNGRSVRDAYSAHPDLYTTPVKMLVVTTSTYANSDAFNTWKTWKIQKGIDVDVLTVAANATASTIKTQIYSKYNANHPSFLVIVGDETVVTYYQLWDYDSSYGDAATDLEYASVDGDVYHDMFLSRIPVSSTTELSNYVNKALTYEKYTMSDPSYLSNVLLIAGADDTWAPRVGRPTINYAANNYFNTSNGFTNVYKYVTSSYTGCYDYLNSGVGFVNYTAHGDIQKWYSPELTNTNVNALTNNDKYFWAMGNCCLTCNFKNAQNSQTCFGETMIRAANKAAFGYIGSVPESYWYEDYYFGVGATSTMNSTPSMSQTKTGVYDFMFDDTQMNTLNSVPFAGNVAVTYAHANNYTSSVTDEYYWRAYQCFGDGSIMPYHTQPAANNVSHANTISIGASSFAVSAVAGSYVAITKDNVILGVAEVPSSGTVNVPISGLTSAGDVMIVVTRQQRQPYITTIQAVAVNGPYITLDSYTPNTALVGQSTNLSLTFKNVGNAATSGTTTVTLSSSNSNVTFGTRTKTFNSLAVNATTTVSGFSFTLNNGVTLGSPVTLHYAAVNGSNTWEGDISITPNQIFNVAVSANNANYGTVSGGGQYNYNQSCTVTATPADGYMFTNWTSNGSVVSTEASYTFNVTANTDLVANFTAGVTVYDGTATNQYIPMYGYYFDDFTKSECIIPASQLTAMTGCTVSSITFYPSSVGTTNSTWGNAVQTVFLKEVSGTTLGGSYSGMNGATTVKVAALDMPVAGEAYTITFDTPYTYNGGNLLIGVYNTTDGSYNKVEWYGTSNLTSGVSAYGYNGSSLNDASYTAQSFLPKTTFNYIPSTTPYISLAPNSATILTGFTETLTANYGNVSGTPSITYTSSNTSVATVSGSGTTATVTAVAAGTATITATMTVAGSTYTATCDVTVENPSYCTPNPTSRDGQGITTLAFGSGDYVVNNSNSNGLPASSPYYGDYTSMVGGYGAGETATVTITYSTGSSTVYSYGTLIWVDWNKNYTFEDSEIVYTGTSAQGSNGTPQVLTATFTIPASQAADDYRMRIAGGDSYFDSYIGGSSSANHDPCFTSTWAVCHDYTLRVVAASNDPVEITATAIPANAGTITGAGTYTPGTQCTLTATANEGYTFTNWTRNGVVISTNANYNITVSTAATYVANFTPNSYTITATAVPAEGGMVTFGARNRDDLVYDFEDGWQGWTTFQGNTTSPNSWMHNTAYPTSNNNFSTGYGYNTSDGFMLSESYISGSSSGAGQAVTPDNYLVSPQVRLGGSISFYAGARNTSYCAEKFSVMVSTTDNTNPASFTTVGTWTLSLSEAGYNSTPYTVDLSAYSGMGYVAIRHFDCYDQWFICVDNVTIVEGVDQSTQNGNFNYGETCVVTAMPNEGYYFVNWTENGTPVSSNASYEFVVTSDRELVANFSDEIATVEETIELGEGWNWWSTNLEITLADLEAALGTHGVKIEAQNGQYASYNPNTNSWSGNLTSFEIGSMYKIKVSDDCTISISGIEAEPTEHTITIAPGNNWIGFISNESLTLDEAFSNYTPTNGDIIKSATGKATYYEGYGWRGRLTTLEPGQGYIYKSNATTTQTFSYPSAK